MPEKKRELELSTYEKQRLENIARNKQKMFSLGLTGIKKALEEIEQPESKKKKTQSTQVEVKIETETIRVRRSSRINPSTSQTTTTIQRKRRAVKVKEESDSSEGEDSTTIETKKDSKIKKEKRLKKKKKTKPVFDEGAFIARLEKEIKEILSKSESSKRTRPQKGSDTTSSKRAKPQPQPQTSNNPSTSTPLKRFSTSTTQTELSFLFSKKQKLHHLKESLNPTTSSSSTSTSTSHSKIHEKGEPSQDLRSFALVNGDLLQTKTTVPLCLSTDFGVNSTELSKSQSVCTETTSFHLRLYGEDKRPYTLYSNNGQVHITESKNSYSCPLQQIDNIFLTSPSPSKPIVCTWNQSHTPTDSHSHSLDKVNNSHPSLSSSPIESKYLSFTDKTYGRKNLNSTIPSLPSLEELDCLSSLSLSVPKQKPCLDFMQREE